MHSCRCQCRVGQGAMAPLNAGSRPQVLQVEAALFPCALSESRYLSPADHGPLVPSWLGVVPGALRMASSAPTGRRSVTDTIAAPSKARRSELGGPFPSKFTRKLVSSSAGARQTFIQQLASPIVPQRGTNSRRYADSGSSSMTRSFSHAGWRESPVRRSAWPCYARNHVKNKIQANPFSVSNKTLSRLKPMPRSGIQNQLSCPSMSRKARKSDEPLPAGISLRNLRVNAAVFPGETPGQGPPFSAPAGHGGHSSPSRRPPRATSDFRHPLSSGCNTPTIHPY
jgi:hypothetical protein